MQVAPRIAGTGAPATRVRGPPARTPRPRERAARRVRPQSPRRQVDVDDGLAAAPGPRSSRHARSAEPPRREQRIRSSSAAYAAGHSGSGSTTSTARGYLPSRKALLPGGVRSPWCWVISSGVATRRCEGAVYGWSMLTPYDAAWPAAAERRLADLRRVLEPLDPEAVFDHIGSTSVPGLLAKPLARPPGPDVPAARPGRAGPPAARDRLPSSRRCARRLTRRTS